MPRGAGFASIELFTPTIFLEECSTTGYTHRIHELNFSLRVFKHGICFLIFLIKNYMIKGTSIHSYSW